MIQKIAAILCGLLICLCPMYTLAAEYGSIQVSLPKDMEGETIQFIKEGEESQKVTVDEEGIAKAVELAIGSYEVEIPETEDYTFMPIQVHVPCWSEEEQRMLYEITIIPKYSIKEKPVPVKETTPPVEEMTSPLTSDSNHNSIYSCAGIISLIILVIMSCHNRFNCDTMTDKYSKNGGYSNGNDNDTKNPRRTRRIRNSSPGTID